jgi:hypothetical protein
MKKISLFLLALCTIVVACQKKSPKVPVDYTVETAQNKPIEDIYIPNKGTYTWALWVKYLGGYHEDSVMIALTGLPADVQVLEDTFKRVPTYEARYVFTTNNAALGKYPVTLTTIAPGGSTRTWQANVNVIPANCADGRTGSYDAANACSARNYNYTATVQANGVANELNIVNFGGYGSATNTRAIINCENDSLVIPQQNIGNGTNLSGKGAIKGNMVYVTYTATTTPLGFPETCNVTMTKK